MRFDPSNNWAVEFGTRGFPATEGSCLPRLPPCPGTPVAIEDICKGQRSNYRRIQNFLPWSLLMISFLSFVLSILVYTTSDHGRKLTSWSHGTELWRRTAPITDVRTCIANACQNATRSLTPLLQASYWSTTAGFCCSTSRIFQ